MRGGKCEYMGGGGDIGSLERWEGERGPGGPFTQNSVNGGERGRGANIRIFRGDARDSCRIEQGKPLFLTFPF